jgi:hypothetical protein
MECCQIPKSVTQVKTGLVLGWMIFLVLDFQRTHNYFMVHPLIVEVLGELNIVD